MGFGTDFNKELEAGIKAGKQAVSFTPIYGNYPDNATMQFVPKVTEHESRPGFYNFQGYDATLVKDKKAVAQFFPNYKMAGASADDAFALLSGKTVKITEWRKDNGKKDVKVDFYNKLDLSKPAEPGQNHPVVKVNADSVSIARLVSREDIIFKDADHKNIVLEKLQAGLTVELKVRERANGAQQSVPVSMQLNLPNDRSMSLIVQDGKGKVLRQPVVEAESREFSQRKGNLVSVKELPEDVVKMYKQQNERPEGGPKLDTGGKKRA